MTPPKKQFSAFKLYIYIFWFRCQWPRVNTPALLGRYSQRTLEAALNTVNYWARGGNREHGAGDTRKAHRACPDQAICLQGLSGQLGCGRHSRAEGEGWRDEGRPSCAFLPGEAGVLSLLHSTALPLSLPLPLLLRLPRLLLHLLLLLERIPSTSPTTSRIHLHPLCVLQAIRKTSDETNGKE